MTSPAMDKRNKMDWNPLINSQIWPFEPSVILHLFTKMSAKVVDRSVKCAA